MVRIKASPEIWQPYLDIIHLTVVLLVPKPTVSHHRSSLAACLFAALLISIPGALGQAQSSSRSTARLPYQPGQEALRNGDLASARTDFEEAVRPSPGDPQSKAALGWGCGRQGKLVAAFRH